MPNAPQRQTWRCNGQEFEVLYALSGTPLRAWVDGEELEGVRLHAAYPELVDVEFAGVRHRVEVFEAGGAVYVSSSLGTSTLVEVPRFPEPDSLGAHGSLVAPMPGTVVRVEVEAGAIIEAGAAVVVLEAMKMEHTVRAPHDGIIAEVRVKVGQSVDVGSVMAVMEEQ